MSLESPLPALKAFSASLSALRETLQPLLTQPLDHIVSKLEEGSSNAAESSATGLEGRLDAAKLQVSIAYVLLDLVWFQLKVQGQDPSTHPVCVELERVRSYFSKIKFVQSGASSASSSDSAGAPTLPGQEGRLRVDQAAAGRLIRGGLSLTEKGKHTKFEEEEETSGSSRSISESSDSEEDGGPSKETSAPSPKKDKKGRVIRDPFEGYDSPKQSEIRTDTVLSRKKRKTETKETVEDSSIPSPSPRAMKKKKSASKKSKKHKKH